MMLSSPGNHKSRQAMLSLECHATAPFLSPSTVAGLEDKHRGGPDPVLGINIVHLLARFEKRVFQAIPLLKKLPVEALGIFIGTPVIQVPSKS
jgi:hypothetical protein